MSMSTISTPLLPMSKIAWATRCCSVVTTTTLGAGSDDVGEARSERARARRWRRPSKVTRTRSLAMRLVSTGRRVLSDDAAVVQEDDLVADAGHLVHLVAGVDDRQIARLAQRFDQRQGPVGDVRIERRGRLVHEHHLRIVQQRFDQIDAGALAGRERQEALAHQLGDAEVAAQLADLVLGFGNPIQAREDDQVFPDGDARPAGCCRTTRS